MSIIDKQRITAVAALEALGYTFSLAEGWTCPAGPAESGVPAAEADAMHALLLLRAEKLAECTEGSDEETELQLITDTALAYEAKRWPNGKESGGNG
jgi:hypothetical protein